MTSKKLNKNKKQDRLALHIDIANYNKNRLARNIIIFII